MATERVRAFLYRGKSDRGNARMRNLSYLLQWITLQASRLSIAPSALTDLLRGGGATFENIEAQPTPAPKTKPVNTALPVVTGTARVGETLTATDGTWTGNPAPTFARQWKADGTNIESATNSTYVPVAEDVGKTISCTVTATNSEGNTSVTSAPTAAVVAAE